MRLLLVTQDFPPDVGGTQTYAYELARHLAPLCDDLLVMAPDFPGAGAFDAACGFEIMRVPARDLFPIRAIARLHGLARRRRFDTAFHVQWPVALPALLARRSGWPKRVFIAAHGRELLYQPPWPKPLLPLYNWTRRWILHQADHLFPVSRFTGTLLRQAGVPPGAITVVHNGTDPQHFSPFDASVLREALGVARRQVVLTVCRLVPRKGVDLVIRALPRVIEAVPEAVYLIGGAGPDEARLRALVQDNGVGDYVRFLGKIEQDALPEHYNAADLFVMPARFDTPHVEGFGIVYLEANACGLPVIGGRSGGIPDAVLENETGLLVDPDDPAALADAKIHVLTPPELADRFGEQGRNRVVEEASWNRIAYRLFQEMAQRAP
jgi:phosphatidylinositol alpha-1,6-mannosyltransferase